MLVKVAHSGEVGCDGSGLSSAHASVPKESLLHTFLNVYTIRFTFEWFKLDRGESLRLTVARTTAASFVGRTGRAGRLRERTLGRAWRLQMQRPPFVCLLVFIKRICVALVAPRAVVGI
jgi:hypothetical protein